MVESCIEDVYTCTSCCNIITEEEINSYLLRKSKNISVWCCPFCGSRQQHSRIDDEPEWRIVKEESVWENITQ